MKKTQKCSIMLLLLLFILPYINFAAAATPDFVGIQENDVFIWDTTFDEDAYEDYLEDRGIYNEAEIDLMIKTMFDDEYDEDVVAWKLVILEIKDKKEKDYKPLTEYELDTVPFIYNFYIIEEDENEWDQEDKYKKGNIIEWDRDLYAAVVSARMGLTALVIANNVNFKRLASEVDDRFDRYYEDAGASQAEETVFFAIERDANGIETHYDRGEELHNDEVGEFESISIYTDDGILEYYEYSYEGDPIYLLELRKSWFVENWWIIAIVAAVAIIIVVIVIIKKR